MRSTDISRRHALLGGGAAALGAYFAWPKLRPFLLPAFSFTDVEDMPGFRRITSGEVTSALDVFAGIGASGADRALADRVAQVRRDPCAALFDGTPGTRGAVRIASFSDYNCPYCRVLTRQLGALAVSADSRVQVTWHELPLLGPASLAAARAALAAQMQGAYLDFHQRLMRTRFQTNEAYLTALADSLGLDAPRLLADASSDAVADRTLTSRALAQMFGFIGTPALVIERTAVLGTLSLARLDKLIGVERRAGPAPCGAEG